MGEVGSSIPTSASSAPARRMFSSRDRSGCRAPARGGKWHRSVPVVDCWPDGGRRSRSGVGGASAPPALYIGSSVGLPFSTRGSPCRRSLDHGIDRASEDHVAEHAGEPPHAAANQRLRILAGCATSYRQSRILARSSVDPHRSTMAERVGKGSFHLRPAFDCRKRELKTSIRRTAALQIRLRNPGEAARQSHPPDSTLGTRVRLPLDAPGRPPLIPSRSRPQETLANGIFLVTLGIGEKQRHRPLDRGRRAERRGANNRGRCRDLDRNRKRPCARIPGSPRGRPRRAGAG